MDDSKQFEKLTANDLEKMFKTAAQHLLTCETELNNLNIFPVADRDTGSNLAQLMKRIISTSYLTSSVHSFFNKLADEALLSACGNSGMIFAAFLGGLSHASENDSKHISITSFLERLDNAVLQAYKAVSDPVEGTILTAMSTWLNACNSLAPMAKDFIFLFQQSLPAIEQAVAQTEQQLSILKSHHLIDAGALAFYKFVQGMLSYLLNPHHTFLPESIQTDEQTHFANDINTPPNYDYCTEMLLSNIKIDTITLREKLQHLGDSLVVNQSPQYIKIHLHTNDPLTVTNDIKRHATIESQKIESMQAQWNVIKNAKYSIALVVDSSADIDPSFLQNEQIHVLPLNMRVGQHHLLDRLTINLKDLYFELHQQHLSAQSAALTPDIARRALSFLANYYRSIIIITISSKLSATHQVLSQVASQFTDIPIAVIDSKKNSAAHGLLAMLAARHIANGLTHQAVCGQIEQALAHTDIWVAVDEFKTMIRSGRAPKLIGVLAGWSQIKPIVSLDKEGKPALAGIAFGRKHAWYKIAKKINLLQKKKNICELAIVHTNCIDRANDFGNYIQQITGIKPSFITSTSTVIGLHAGQGCVGVAIISKDSKHD